MAEWRLFEEGTVPVYTTAEWYADRERAPHWDQPDHHPRLALAAEFVSVAAAAGAKTLVDLGAGDGGLLAHLPDGVGGWGYDLSPEAVEGARERGVAVHLLDVVNEMDKITWADITVATEMLEHQVDPHGFLAQMTNARLLVVSSPSNETAESHYGFHTWAWDYAGYAAMIESAGFRILRHEGAGTFQVVLAYRKV